MPRVRMPQALAAILVLLCVTTGAHAGPVNPNISVIGQPFMRSTGDPAVPDGKHPRLDVGETEVVLDAYLNPYSSGVLNASFSKDGASVEEGYFTVFRGLPLGLNVKGGKYRVGFGKLNPAHPHTYPFFERPRVLAAYLPGDESLNETGIDVSRLIPIVGDASITASADYLQGDSFRITRASTGDPHDPLESGEGDGVDRSRPAILGRLSSFLMVGQQSGLEIGASAVSGTNNVAARTRTTVLGADMKAKLWRTASSYLVLQGEGLKLVREDATWAATTGYSHQTIRPTGGYAFADYYLSPRYDAGASFEAFRETTAQAAWDKGIGAFAGYSVLEESLVFRGEWKRFVPAHADAYNTFTFWVIYSMGPHKAHQF